MKVGFPWTHVIMLVCHLVALHSLPLTNANLMYNPQIDVRLCGRGGRLSWICDPFSVLSRTDADKLDRTLEEIQSETQCACDAVEYKCNTTSKGYTISIAILPYLPHSRQDPVTAENYADYLRRYVWRFGKCGDDVVIVLSKREKQVYASVGPTAALKLKSLIVNDIYSDSRQFFDNGEFCTGLSYMLESFREAFEATYEVTPDFPVWPVVQMAIGALFVLTCFCSMYLCRKLYS
ncbi:uncharacterized protein [Diadema antillarum]|uniref:uncharacterized protein n=1 Tax=Diadema antillarum TaxID=105358 RepID=UPI003A8AB2FE